MEDVNEAIGREDRKANIGPVGIVGHWPALSC